MAVKKKGATGFWFLDGISVAAASAAATGTNAYAALTGTFNLQATSGSREAEIHDTIKSNVGIDQSEAYANDVLRGTFTGKPTGATLAAAKTANILPQSGTIFTVVAADEAYLAGDWTIDGADWKGENTSSREIVLKVHKNLDNSSVHNDAV